MRSAVLTLATLGLTMAVLGNAWVQRQQFYPSVVYITKSNPSMAVIYLQSLVVVVMMGKLMRKVFFGQLRAAEFEHLMERSWYAVTETCLAFTVFKDDFSPKFVALFVLLLFLKSFHWLAEDRVDYMERSPVITLLFHLRVLSLAIVLASLDLFFIQNAYLSTTTKGASVQLVFGFEYAILLTLVANTLVKYILHSVDLHSELPWENKAVFMLYTELVIGFLKVLLYVLFFCIMVKIYTLPLFAVRPMYLTMRAFIKAFNDVLLSRRAIHNMNTMYPDATAEELRNTDNVCIICREEMASPTAKKLPCNHIFHKNCLRSWFQRQQTCPTCRLDVLRQPLAAGSAAAAAGGAVPAAGAAQGPGGPAAFQAQVAALRAQLEAMQQQQRAGGAQQLQGAAAAGAAGGQQLPPNLFAMFNGMQQFPQQQGAPQPATSAPGEGAPGTAPPPAGAAASPLRPALLLTPPPFPFMMPFGVPPPMPPPNFQGMSDSELLVMEGNERQHVEARIRCLRNIQILLDAAVMEMQQYSAVVARWTPPSSQVPTAATPSPPAAAAAHASTPSPPAAAAAHASTPSPPAATSSSPAVSSLSGTPAPAVSSILTASSQAATSSITASPVLRNRHAASRLDSSSSSVTASSQSVSSSSVTASPSVSSSVKDSPCVSSKVSATASVSAPKLPLETGARPKTVETVGVKTSSTSSSSVKQSSGSSVLEGKTENPFQSLAGASDKDEIRRRRLQVFEEQKKRLMKK